VKRLAIVASVLALGACEKADNEPGPGGVTMGEARALDEAAEMIEARRPPADLLVPSAGQPTVMVSQTGPATN
jgi:hypothetical protein